MKGEIFDVLLELDLKNFEKLNISTLFYVIDENGIEVKGVRKFISKE